MNSDLESFKPFVPPSEKQKEFSFRAVTLGIILAVFFVLGNTYLGLKVGMTVSASIPAAVISMSVLRMCCKNVTILENNLVQTMATVGESIAAGVVFSIPALFLLGERPPILNIFLLSLLGGVLGVLFMIPVRRYIIVQEHGVLPFPEGMACAEILKAGEKGHPNAILAIWGILVGLFYKLLSSAVYLWNETISVTLRKYEDVEISMDGTPALLGVGYIIGPRISAVLFAGGGIGWLVLIPMIKKFGQGTLAIFPANLPISAMSAPDIWSHYIRYIGAGAVAFGGLAALFKIAPMIRKTVVEMFRELFHLFTMKKTEVERTDQDIPLSYLLLGSLAIILFLWLFPGFHLNIVSIIALIVLGFFFVAVTSITVGIVGSSSSPVSGVTITILLIICFILLGLGWTDRVHLIGAITMSAVANIAVSSGSSTSQDLKAGFLLGATPRLQQLAEIIAAILPAVVVGFTLYLLNASYQFGSETLPAPQATMMALIAKGVINRELPGILVSFGVVLGLLLYLMRVPVLACAIGLYLPLSVSTGILCGGMVHLIVKHLSEDKRVIERGVLLSSGLVAGDACMGILIALLAVLGIIPTSKPGMLNDGFGLFFFLCLALFLGLITCKNMKKTR